MSRKNSLSDSRNESITEIYTISPFAVLSPSLTPSELPLPTLLEFTNSKLSSESLTLKSYATENSLDEEEFIGYSDETQGIPTLPLNGSNSYSRPSFANDSTTTLHLGGTNSLSERRPILIAILKVVVIMLFSLLLLYLTLSYLLPPIAKKDKDFIKIPKSFQELKDLNKVLQIYKEQHYYRVMGGWIVTYLFLQAFSVPGSMYLSILGGAMFGVVIALPLVCVCVATGALLCYLLSSALGPPLLMNSEKWRNRVQGWKEKVGRQQDRGDLFSYLIILRISPLPPHWVVNVIAPHLGIPIWQFWTTTALGILGVSYIHCTIGTTLDQMTSSDDFKLISWKNFLTLAGIVIAVLIPVFLRRAWKSDLDDSTTLEEPIPPSPPLDSDLSESTVVEDELPSHRRNKPFKITEEDEDWLEDNEERSSGSGEGGGNGEVRRAGSLSKASRLLGVNLKERP